MTTVFASFALTGVPAIKEIGLGLAVAIAVDATITRLVLVPATMRLLGDWNWWMPGWLDRLLPHVAYEAPRRGAEPGALDRSGVRPTPLPCFFVRPKSAQAEGTVFTCSG